MPQPRHSPRGLGSYDRLVWMVCGTPTIHGPWLSQIHPGVPYPALVFILTQDGFYNRFYLLYLVSPRTAHPVVGYFEAGAVIGVPIGIRYGSDTKNCLCIRECLWNHDFQADEQTSRRLT